MSSSLLQDLPYINLQNIASFLAVDDRYAFAETCLQICDAVDSDLVWLGANKENTDNNTNASTSGHHPASSTETNDEIILSLLPEEERMRTLYDRQVQESIKKFVPAIENPLPTDPAYLPREVALVSSIMQKVVSNAAPHSFRFKSEGFKKFQFMVVDRMISRTCRILAQESELSRTAADWRVFDALNNTNSLKTRNQLRDEMDDCMLWKEIEYVVKNKHKKFYDENTRVLDWAKQVSEHARELIMFIDACNEMKYPAQTLAITHLGSGVIYGYFKIIQFYVYAVNQVLSRFEWTRTRTVTYRRILSDGYRKILDFLAFPRFGNQSLALVLEDKKNEVLFADPKFIEKCKQLGFSNGFMFLDFEALRKDPSLISKGLGGCPVDVLVVGSFLFGVSSSYMGGRLPSLHYVPTRFATSTYFHWKIAYEIMMTTVRRNFDALIFFLCTRMFDSFFPAIDTVASGITKTAKTNKISLTAFQALKFMTTLVLPKFFRDRFWQFDAWTDEIGEKFFKKPFLNYIGRPIANACTNLYQGEFGPLSKAAASSLVISGSISVAVSLLVEHERPSWKKTVTRQRFRSLHAMMSHAAFAASLAILRWKMYFSGYSFWKTVAVESAIRIGVSVVELYLSRYNRFWNKKIDFEKRRRVQEREVVYELDHAWESDNEGL